MMKLAIALSFLSALSFYNCQFSEHALNDYISNINSESDPNENPDTDVDTVDVESVDSSGRCYCVDNSQCSQYSFEDIVKLKRANCYHVSLICCPESDITCRCTEQINCVDEFQNAVGHCTGNQICCSNIRPVRSAMPSPIPAPPDEILCGTRPVNTKKRFDAIIKLKTRGGQLADDKEYPWFVAILNKTGIYSFAGSLVHPQVVLTAAHRVYGISAADISVKAGSANLQSASIQSRFVRHIVPHPRFEMKKYYTFNIAILILDSPFKITLGLSTICLPNSDITYDETKCVSGGWGKDESDPLSVAGRNLRYVEIPVVDSAMCQSKLQTSALTSGFHLHESFICAQGEMADTAEGDGGSPFVCRIDKDPARYVQVGITSWGIDCEESTCFPGVYSSTEYVMTWITNLLLQEFGWDVDKFIKP